jgi:circadian clock protein KaiC
MHRRPASKDPGRYQDARWQPCKDIREYEITSKGVVIIGERLTDYQGLITGIPQHLNRSGNNEERSNKLKAKSKS